MAESMLQDKISRMLEHRTAPLILELDLTDGLAEEPPTDPVSAFLTMRRPRLADVLDGLRRARADHRVRALGVRVGGRPRRLAGSAARGSARTITTSAVRGDQALIVSQGDVNIRIFVTQ